MARIMFEQLRELITYKDLLKQLVLRDLKVRYKNSVLGFFWSLLNPLVRVATITIVIKYVMRLDIPNYSAYLLAAYLPWVFFQTALLDSSQVIIHHRDLLRKVYFPREVLPLSAVASNLVHFLLALLVFFAYLIIYIHLILDGSGLLITTLLLPVLIGMQCLLIVGLTYIVSCLNVFYEDTKYILSVLLDVFFYLTPIMYPAELVYSRIANLHLPEIYRTLLYKLYLLNPMNVIADAYRKSLLPPTQFNLRGIPIESLPLDYGMLAVAAAVCAIVAVGGYAFFNSRKWIFPERV
jgi:lipopolysaccharide transport system permease protein